jgi:hypothetical protein
VSPNQLPIFQARVFCRRTCDSGIAHYVHRGTQGEGTEESGVPTPSVDLAAQTRSGADTAQHPEL